MTSVGMLALLFLQVLGGAMSGGPVYNPGTEKQQVSQPTAAPTNELITQTVYGFLDFTTTIANTVMVFSPQSQPAVEVEPSKPTKTAAPSSSKISATKVSSVVQVRTAAPVLSSRVEVREGPSIILKGPSKPKPESKPVEQSKKITVSSGKQEVVKTSQKPPEQKITVNVKTEVKTDKVVTPSPPSLPEPSSQVQVISSSEEVFENHLDQAEYDLLLKQPSEVVEETYKIADVAPSTKPRNSGPTGLITRLGGTIVKEGITTIHETSVIGTFISGKYAQVLKSSSQIVNRVTPTPHRTQVQNYRTRIGLEPSVVEEGLPLEALFTTPPNQNLVRQSRRPNAAPASAPGQFKNRLQRTRPQDLPEPTKRQTSRSAFKLSHNRFSRPSQSTEVPTVSVFSETLSPSRRYQRNRSVATTSSIINNIDTGTRRFKPKPSAVSNEASTSLYKFKLSRPQGRWQYKSSPKPRVAIRRQDEEGVQSTATQPLPELEQSEVNADSAETFATTQLPTPSLPIQTIKVDISTPADFSNTYYEIATIKSPYTFSVGTVKNTRYITLTTTVEKYLIEPTEASTVSNEPLTENILTTKPALDKEASIATLPAIAIAGEETLPLETAIETFSTSETLLKTHLLPVVRDSDTSTLTLVQTYEVTKMVTATKTLPPTELFQFIPSKTLNEFNTRLDEAGSELHLELEFGDSNNNEDEPPAVRAILPEFANATYDNQTLLTTTTTSSPVTSPIPLVQEQLSPEKLQQLALLRLLNPNQPPIVTSTPVLSVHTLFETHVIPVFNGLSTVFSTISRPVGTVTSTQFVSSTIALPSIPLPLYPTPQLQPQLTSTPIVTQTVVTETDSKVLKLTFGAKTAYTTLYSTKVVPTVLTTYITAALPTQPTIAPFPSFFPPYNPFNPINPFVG